MSGSIGIVKIAGGQVGRLRRERSAERWEGKNSFSHNRLPVAGQIDALQVDPKQLVTTVEYNWLLPTY